MKKIYSFFPDISASLRFLNDRGSRKKICLDIGVGKGENSKFLLDRGWSVKLIEKDLLKAENLLELIKKYGEKAEIIEKDFVNWDMKKNIFSLVLCTNVFHFIKKEHYTECFKKIINAISPGGIAIFSILTPNSLNKPEGFVNGLYLEEVKEFFKELDFLHSEVFETKSGQNIAFLTVFKPIGFLRRLLEKIFYK